MPGRGRRLRLRFTLQILSDLLQAHAPAVRRVDLVEVACDERQAVGPGLRRRVIERPSDSAALVARLAASRERACRARSAPVVAEAGAAIGWRGRNGPSTPLCSGAGVDTACCAAMAAGAAVAATSATGAVSKTARASAAKAIPRGIGCERIMAFLVEFIEAKGRCQRAAIAAVEARAAAALWSGQGAGNCASDSAFAIGRFAKNAARSARRRGRASLSR